jgi:hypothetical protein
MFIGMFKFWASTILKPYVPKTQVSESMALRRSKAFGLKEKIPRQIVDYVQLSTIVTSYNLHFANYNLGKKHVIHSFLLLCGSKFTLIIKPLILIHTL